MSSLDDLLQTVRQRPEIDWQPLPEAWAELVAATHVARPQSVEALRELLRAANERAVPVFPVGGGTQLDWGLPAAREGFALCTQSLRQVIDYPARDMTITVQAGLTWAELADRLATENQWLPVDVPFAQQATVAGSVAANISGPRRFGYGTLRDYVIGIAVVTPDGKLARAGGRVVKNVAGYDLCKLYTGSFGTLAVIVELTFRVRPRPEASRLACVRCASLAAADRVFERLVRSRTRPVAVELLNHAGAVQLAAPGAESMQPTQWLVFVGFEGFGETVDWQLKQLADEFGGADGVEAVEVVPEPETASIWHRLTERRFVSSPVLFKAGCRPSQLAEFLDLADDAALAVQAHGATGIVWLWPTDPERVPGRDWFDQIHGWLSNRKGYLVVKGARWCRKEGVAPWGGERPDLTLMHRVKQTYDPNDILNPGRFITAEGATHSMQQS